MPGNEDVKGNGGTDRSTAIPIRYFKDESELPQNVSYSLGGTIYGTTPGGKFRLYRLKYRLNLNVRCFSNHCS